MNRKPEPLYTLRTKRWTKLQFSLRKNTETGQATECPCHSSHPTRLLNTSLRVDCRSLSAFSHHPWIHSPAYSFIPASIRNLSSVATQLYNS